MPTPFESAQLNLQLFELRRDPLLREARQWFLFEFNPETAEDVVRAFGSEKNAWMRMVIGYWDMASSMVTSGAIDGNAFRAAHGEIIGTFSKLYPFIGALRKGFGEPEFCKHIETVVLAAPDAEATMTRRREKIRAAAKARRAGN